MIKTNEEIKKEFKEKFCNIKICKCCNKTKCDNSTTGCPWYVDTLILNKDGQSDTVDNIVDWFFSIRAQDGKDIREDERQTTEKEFNKRILRLHNIADCYARIIELVYDGEPIEEADKRMRKEYKLD